MCWEIQQSDLPCHSVWGTLPRHQSFLTTWQWEPNNPPLSQRGLEKTSAVSTWGLSPLYSRLEKCKLFPPICCIDFSVCFMNTCDSCIAYKKRCSWSNGYRRRNWTQRHQFKSWTDCISHSTNTLGKGMNPIILPPTMGK